MKNSVWDKSDYAILSLIPIEILIGFFKPHFLTEHPLILSLVGFIVAVLIFAIVLRVRGTFLREEASKFRTRRLRNWLYVFLVVIIFGVVQGIVDKVFAQGTISLTPGSTGYRFAALLSFFIPLMAPFTEEIVFRYELFYKFIKSGKSVLILMAFISSGLFGLAHFISGDQLVSIVELGITGLLLTGVYYKTKNIWVTILGHFIWNFLLALPTLAVVFLNIPMGK